MNKPLVHILATVRNPALLEGSLLVFKTLRAGFPRAEVVVHGNGLEWYARQELARACREVGATFQHDAYVPHDEWIEGLLLSGSPPFWICDTDVVFFGCVENWFLNDTGTVLAGRFEPEFDEQWTKTRHMARLHTALMYFNAPEVRCLMRQWMSRVPPPWGLTAQMNLVRQSFVPVRHGPTLFYDSCAGLYHAGMGTPFSEQMDYTFEHLHAATYADLLGREPSLRDLAAVHKAIYADPSAARGLSAKQAQYYKQFSPKTTLVISEDKPPVIEQG